MKDSEREKSKSSSQMDWTLKSSVIRSAVVAGGPPSKGALNPMKSSKLQQQKTPSLNPKGNL
jgi:hypothetical protein